MKDTITLYKEKGRKGSEIDRIKYETIYRFIIGRLSVKTTITVTQLLDSGFAEFPCEDRNSLARTVLEVKRDLAIRGIIKVQFDLDRMQHIRLTRRSKFLPDDLINSG